MTNPTILESRGMYGLGHQTAPGRNSVPGSTFLRGFTDAEIKQASEEFAAAGKASKNFPGTRIPAEMANDLDAALAHAGANFNVVKRVNFNTSIDLVDGKIPQALLGDLQADEAQAVLGEAGFAIDKATVHTAREDTGAKLGNVGVDYGVVQTKLGAQALGILAANGHAEITTVQNRGGQIRITALVGQTTFVQTTGKPNTLGHYIQFDIAHDGMKCNQAKLYTLRLECLNGMTSSKVVKSHKLRHTSKAADRAEKFSLELLSEIIGEAKAEAAMFEGLANEAMTAAEFKVFATEFLGGTPDEEDSQHKKTRFENEFNELVKFFEGGNEGAGATKYGAYNSVTAHIRDKIEAAKDRVKKFESSVTGDSRGKARRALGILTR
jgi:hypothetical protein